MKRLLTINEETFGRKVGSNIPYNNRQAVRAVLLNKNGEVYLLHVTTQSYHKLPGGGIDSGENLQSALKREILEETGYKSTIGNELGEIVEYRDFDVGFGPTEQYSYNYLAVVHGEQEEQNLDEGEIEEGHEIVIAESVDKAVAMLESDMPKNIEGEYIKLRDMTILKEAKEYL